jgi:hypothetical protein
MNYIFGLPLKFDTLIFKISILKFAIIIISLFWLNVKACLQRQKIKHRKLIISSTEKSAKAGLLFLSIFWPEANPFHRLHKILNLGGIKKD